MQSVIRLRNALVHFEPESLPAGRRAADMRTSHKFEGMLKGKFSLNPFTGEGNAFWPSKALSHGCAKWALKSTVAFVEDFVGRMGGKLIIHHVKPELLAE